jgi:hypothetical protein
MFSTARLAECLGNAIACCILLLSLGCAPGTNAVANPADGVVKQDITIVPDPEIQEQIGRVLYPNRDGPRRDELQVLAKMGGQDYEKLIPQLLYFSMYGMDPAGKHDLKEGWALAGFSELLKISHYQIATALLPYLGTTDAKLRHKLHGLFDGFNYAFLQDFMQGRLRAGKDLPQELVRCMYQRNPGEALLTMSRTLSIKETWEASRKQSRPLIWAEHVVSDTLWKHEREFLEKTKVEPEAAVQIEKSAIDKDWWVRLYAAEIMRQHPAFRKLELLQKLAKDENPLVRESAEAALAKPKPKPSPPSPPPPSPSTKEQKK